MTQDRGAGDLIDDRFRLRERLGSGAMGTVWLALDELLQREVALKQVRPADAGLATDPDYAEMLRTRVLREARALARIHHPHVVTIHHVVVVPGEAYPWLVMELVRGGTLEDRLAAGPMEPAEVAELGRGLLGALRAAHASGICHRDVKPANVLLRPDGSPVLTDFGIADLADTSRLTVTGGLTGSPAYIAPERLHGSEGDPASDLWSLGMLLYVAVEGHHPLRRTTAAATLAAVLSGVVPAASRAGRLDPALRAVLVADPAGRVTAEQLDALLIQALDPGPPGSPYSSGSWPVASAGSAAQLSPGTVTPLARSIPPAGVGRTGEPVPSAVEPAGAVEGPLPGEGSSTVDRWPGPPPKRRSRAGVAIAAVAGALVLLLIAGVAGIGYFLVPWLRDQANLTVGSPPSGIPSVEVPPTRHPRTGDPTTGGGDPPTSAEPKDPESSDGEESEGPPSGGGSLHTRKGMEVAVAAVEQAAGTTKVTRLVVYPDYAVAEVPVKGRKSAFDSYLYRDGEAKLWNSGSGTSDGKSTTDLKKIDWDLVPKLMKRADETLNLPKPEYRYVIIDAVGIFTDGKPSISIYLSDKYGGGHLTADLDGTILDTHPAP